MKCTYTSVEEALEDDHLITKNIGFITGKSSSGKTTFANQYAKKGFEVIEIDDIAKRKVNPKFELTQDESIDIVRGKAPLVVENYFVEQMHHALKKGLSTSGKAIVEGTMSSLRVLNKIFDGKYSDYTLIFIYPGDRLAYKKRVMKRFKSDIETGSQTLPIWDFIDTSVVDSFKSEGFDSVLVDKYINDLVTRFFEGGKDRYKLLEELDREIITICV